MKTDATPVQQVTAFHSKDIQAFVDFYDGKSPLSESLAKKLIEARAVVLKDGKHTVNKIDITALEIADLRDAIDARAQLAVQKRIRKERGL